jgi:hypothetical protein
VVVPRYKDCSPADVAREVGVLKPYEQVVEVWRRGGYGHTGANPQASSGRPFVPSNDFGPPHRTRRQPSRAIGARSHGNSAASSHHRDRVVGDRVTFEKSNNASRLRGDIQPPLS